MGKRYKKGRKRPEIPLEKRCISNKKDGEPCPNPRAHGLDVCIAHNPKAHRRMVSKGGKVTAQKYQNLRNLAEGLPTADWAGYRLFCRAVVAKAWNGGAPKSWSALTSAMQRLERALGPHSESTGTVLVLSGSLAMPPGEEPAPLPKLNGEPKEIEDA